ncbi:MAG: cell division protein FtsA [Acidobacteriota bacterium]|jgi:cell division protein FtsA|nr:cell division protein FtsA [Acidobacteriota bacterium]
MKDNYLVGIDIGTKKICTIIGQVKGDIGQEELEVIGYGLAETSGVRKGVIVDMQGTVDSIRRSVKEAEITAGVEAESAYVNISGSHIQSINAKGSINITGRNREITKDDVDRAVTHGSSIMLPNDKDILHVLTQEFIVDTQEGVKNPIGMIGTNLEVYIHIVTASLTATKNLLICLKKAKMDVIRMVLSHIATAESVLMPDEKELGVALIDIGAGTTDIAVFEKGALSYSATIGVGGDNFTNDLAIGTRTPIDRAEMIKRKYGCGMDPNWKNQNIEIPSVGGKKRRCISVSLLTDILKPRAEEIFEMAKEKIESQGLSNSINAGVVITGGSAQLEGLMEIADDIFAAPVRLGKPFGMGGLIDKVNSPDFATATGLIKYGMLDLKDKGILKQKPEGFFQRVKRQLGF